MRKPRREKSFKRNFRTFVLTHPLIPYRTLSGHFLTKDALRVLICCMYDNDDALYHGFESNVTHLDAYLGEHSPRPMNHTEMYHAVLYLERIGLLENVHGTKDDFRFNITYECVSYFQLKRRAFVYRLCNSVLLPVIISVITALVVCGINV